VIASRWNVIRTVLEKLEFGKLDQKFFLNVQVVEKMSAEFLDSSQKIMTFDNHFQKGNTVSFILSDTGLTDLPLEYHELFLSSKRETFQFKKAEELKIKHESVLSSAITSLSFLVLISSSHRNIFRFSRAREIPRGSHEGGRRD